MTKKTEDFKNKRLETPRKEKRVYDYSNSYFLAALKQQCGVA